MTGLEKERSKETTEEIVKYKKLTFCIGTGETVFFCDSRSKETSLLYNRLLEVSLFYLLLLYGPFSQNQTYRYFLRFTLFSGTGYYVVQYFPKWKLLNFRKGL